MNKPIKWYVGEPLMAVLDDWEEHGLWYVFADSYGDKVHNLAVGLNESEARLIAAAPDLLEAAKAIMDSTRGKHLPAKKVGKMMEAIAKAEEES